MTDYLAGRSSSTIRLANVDVVFDARRIVRIVAICAAVIWGLGLFRQIVVAILNVDTDPFGWDLINLDAENNLPAWFSGLLLFSVGMTALFLAQFARGAEPRNVPWWTALGAFFVLLSADEIMKLHETTVAPLRAIATWTGLLHFPWVVWALPLLVVVALCFVPLLRRLPRATTVRLGVATAVGILGAVGMEMVAGVVIGWRGRGDYYAICFLIEEGAEMTGVVLFLRALLLHIAGTTERITLAVRG